MWTRWLALGLLVACGGKNDDSAASAAGTGTPYLNVLSPTSGEFLDEGQDVLLEAEGRRGDGAPAELSSVTWTSTDGLFAVEGNGLVVNNLHPGIYALEVRGTIEGQDVSDVVDVAVYSAR